MIGEDPVRYLKRNPELLARALDRELARRQLARRSWTVNVATTAGLLGCVLVVLVTTKGLGGPAEIRSGQNAPSELDDQDYDLPLAHESSSESRSLPDAPWNSQRHQDLLVALEAKTRSDATVEAATVTGRQAEVRRILEELPLPDYLREPRIPSSALVSVVHAIRRYELVEYTGYLREAQTSPTMTHQLEKLIPRALASLARLR
ncbi:MAG: hypothetical protein KDB53_18700 [Planctomycetes bacterium]|nr:hypothetical protein [Planctomycetota bacterium]